MTSSPLPAFLSSGSKDPADEAVANILLSRDVYIENVKKLDQFAFSSNEPCVQYPSQGVDLDTHIVKALVDGGRFDSLFSSDLENLTKLETLTVSGRRFVHMLYTFRSVSRAIPMVSQQAPANATKEMLEEFEARKDEINDRIIDVLRPEILKLKELMVFVGSFVIVVKNCLQLLASTESKGKTVPEGVYTAFLDAIDLVVKLDTLKDSKSSLSNDFSRYKRSIQLQSRKMSASDMSQINEEMTQLQMFLVNPDPRKAKNFIYLTLREEVKKIPGHEDVLVDLLEYALESTEKNLFMTPDEKHRALRVVPFLMLLIDGEAADPRSLNVFTTKKLNIPGLQQLFNKHPVLPLYADMTITVIYIFERSPHFDRGEVAKLWGDDLPVKTAAEHNVASHWERIKTSFNAYSTNLLCVLRNIDHFEFVKSADKENIARMRIVYEIVKDGLGYIAEWNGVLSRVMAWKFTHPCPQEHLNKIGADHSTAGFEYERLVKYNFTKTELTKFVDVMSMIKSLSGILDRVKLKLATIIRFHIHHQVQQLVQGTLLPILHRMDKRKKDSFAGLLRLRQMTADWVDGIEPIEDYKAYSRKLGQIDAVHPARVVGPTYVQLQLLRSELLALYDEKSLARKRNGLFGKSDLEKEDITELEQFYRDSFYFPYMLDFSGTLREVSDLSYLWYRELYLEATRCTQFPIDMSLPWLLTEHIISNQSGVLPIIENVFYTLDVYNDAAYRALFVLNQQFLYDEIEAETNLVFDQFVFLLSEELFAHYKDVAAYMILDKDFKDKLELNGILNLKLSKRRYDIPVLQRRVQLLGRSIDLNFLICQHVNNLFLRDVEHAFKRFESHDLCGLIEFDMLIKVIRETHSLLSELLQLDPFENIFKEMNESFNPKAVRGLMNSHIVKCLTKDLLPNFSYNLFTQRFVKSALVLKPCDYVKAPKATSASFGFGSLCGKAYENYAKLTLSYFGKPHLESLFRISGAYLDISLVLEECLNFIWMKLLELKEYSIVIRQHVPAFNLPNVAIKSESCLGYFETKLKALLEFEDLKKGLFQDIRELGNTIAFVQMLSEVTEVKDQLKFMMVAPVLGVNPNTVVFRRDQKIRGVQGLDVDGLMKASPIGKVVGEVLAAAKDTPQYGRCPPTLNSVPDLLYRIINSISRTTDRTHIFYGFLRKVQAFLEELKLDEEWGKKYASGSLDTESTQEFSRFWSSINFVYIFDEYSRDAPADLQVIDEAGNTAYVKNDDEFGHGFSICGCLMMHFLRQREQFELLDYSSHVLSLYNYESKIRSEPSVDAGAARLIESRNKFVVAATFEKLVHAEVFSMFEAVFSTPPGLKGKSVAMFKPPSTDAY